MYKKRTWAIWSIVTLFAGFQLFIGILFGISIKELATKFSISSADVSNIVAIYFLFYALMQIPAGVMIDKLSIKYTLFTVSILIIIGLLILGSTHSTVLAYLSAVLMGTASSFIFISAVILIERWFTLKMFSIAVGMTSGLYGLTASLFAYFIMELHPIIHVSKVFLTAGVAAIFAILIPSIIKDYPHENNLTDINKKNINIITAIYKSVSNIQIILASIMTALVLGSMLAFITFWNIQYQTLYGLNTQTISLLNITALTGMAIGAPSLGWLSERIGKRKPVGFMICICLFFCLVIILQPINLSLPTVYIMMFLIGFFANNVSIGFSIVKENSEPQHIGTSIAFANTILFLGLSLFQFIPGKILSYPHIFKNSLIKLYITKNISIMSISFYCYPIAILIAFIILFFIKETNCKSTTNQKK
jgi:MFS family permease